MNPDKPLIGLEIEFHLIDDNGNLFPIADEILADEEASPYMLKELTHSMLEVIAPPARDIRQLEQNIRKEVETAVAVAGKHGAMLVPSTTVGREIPLKRKGTRYDIKELVLGQRIREMEYHICGTHVHVDRANDIVGQHRLMTGLDPVFTLMSSSPFFLGSNTLNDYRVMVYRRIVFKKLPLNGALLPYIGTQYELDKRLDETYKVWVGECEKRGADLMGFGRLNSCWGPIRFSENTIEARSNDTNVMSRVLALSAVYSGLNRQLGEYNFPVPPFDTLKRFESEGIRNGLRSDELHKYLQSVLDAAEDGLERHEIPYLGPFRESLEIRRNFSDEITGFSKRNGLYDGKKVKESEAKVLRRYISQRFMDDLHTLYR